MPSILTARASGTGTRETRCDVDGKRGGNATHRTEGRRSSATPAATAGRDAGDGVSAQDVTTTGAGSGAHLQDQIVQGVADAVVLAVERV